MARLLAAYVRWFPIALTLVACGPQGVSDCTTRCGMAVYGTQDCEGVDKAEQQALTAFERDVGWSSSSMCSALNGAHLQNRGTPDGTWTDAWGRRVAGLTYCESKSLLIGTDVWAASAMAHEMAHLFECYVDWKAPTNHEDWDARNIHWAIAHAVNPPKEWSK